MKSISNITAGRLFEGYFKSVRMGQPASHVTLPSGLKLEYVAVASAGIIEPGNHRINHYRTEEEALLKWLDHAYKFIEDGPRNILWWREPLLIDIDKQGGQYGYRAYARFINS